jgi:hypothetical protein
MRLIQHLNSLGYNRALIKKFEGLPNVAEFYTKRIGIHEYAAFYGVEKVLRELSAIKLDESDRANRYLERQMFRITRYALHGQYEKANWLALVMVRKSRTFKMLALNRVMPDWYLLNVRKLRSIWRKVNHLSLKLATNVEYKRVWIDKKPGDYGRPLGVPTPEWRIYSYMMLEVLERITKASGHLTTWQHGGRSGKGLLTAWQSIIPKLSKFKYIYEFDLKGFFDNISHDAIRKAFKNRETAQFSDWIGSILGHKPSKYELPDVKVDRPDPYKQAMRKYLESILSPGPELEEYLQYYEEHPEEIMLNITLGKPTEDKETYNWRGDRREEWKGLGLEGKGVPQGFSISPFLSTHTLEKAINEDRHLRKQIIMYMDDGVLFARSRQSIERGIQRLKAILGLIGIELAPEKSGFVKENNKWKKDFKFLGLEYLPDEDLFQSKTRNGTQVKFPTTIKWDVVKDLALINNTTVSGIKKRFDITLNTKSHEAGLKYGFLGCLIANSQYRNNPPISVKKQMIADGKALKLYNILLNKQGFIWKFQDLYPVVEDLTTISSIVCANFMAKRGRVWLLRRRRRPKKMLPNLRVKRQTYAFNVR